MPVNRVEPAYIEPKDTQKLVLYIKQFDLYIKQFDMAKPTL